MALPPLSAFVNTHILKSGQAVSQDIYFSPDTGTITPNFTRSRPDINVTKIDLEGKYLVAPGYLELQINGLIGVHFTRLGKGDAQSDELNLRKVARALVKKGVTAWWATVPTVASHRWNEILPVLAPRTFANGATLLGAHVEGPYLHPSKRGVHSDSFLLTPSSTSAVELYGESNLRSVIKHVTLAPELPGSLDLIRHLQRDYPQITISLGHSTATYQQGLEALRAGAKCLTHLYNAMSPLHHRDPGLVGLISNNPSPTSASNDSDLLAIPDQQLLSSTMSADAWLARHLSAFQPHSPSSPEVKPECYFSLIPDTIHLHPSILAMSHRTSPDHTIVITDAIELAGLPDGVYPANDQITAAQTKVGNRATVVGEDEKLIGSCITLDECVRNMVAVAGCSLAEAVRCVTENVARMMDHTAARGIRPGMGMGMGTGMNSGMDRGRLDIGCRADFVVLDRDGNVRQTWIEGVKVWDCEDESTDDEDNHS